MAKICLVASSVFGIGGEQRVTAVIANELAKQNEVIIYTMDEKEIWKKNPYQLSEQITVRYTAQPVYSNVSRIIRRVIREINEKTNLMYQRKCFYRLLEYAYFRKDWQKRMLAELTTEAYDVIMAVSGSNSLKLGLIADRLDCMTAGWEHNSFEAYFRTKGLYLWHMDQLFERSVRNLDHCVVLNHYISRKYKEAFGADCDVIYNPRSFVSEEKSELKNKTFVACGRLIYQKGFDLLVDSFRKFAESDKEWKLVLIGDGEMRQEVEEKIVRYGLEDRITITGYTQKVREYLKDASVYLLSSRWEGFPMVLTEAFEMGLPVVAYDITAVEPLVSDGTEGLLAKSFDTDDFAKQMLRITRLQPGELRAMAENAGKKAESLAVEHIIEDWKKLLGAD